MRSRRSSPNAARRTWSAITEAFALPVAAANPGAVRSLALFEPVAFGALDPSADLPDARADGERADCSWGPSAAERERWLETFVDYWGGMGAWAALREDARAEFLRVAWVVREGARTLAADRTPASTYAVLRVPVLLMTAGRSPVAVGRIVQRLGESLPESRTVVLPDAGHMAPLTHGGRVNELVVLALQGCRGVKRWSRLLRRSPLDRSVESWRPCRRRPSRGSCRR